MKKLFSFLARPIVWSTAGLLVLLLALHVVSPLLGIEEDNRWIIELLMGGPLAILLVGYWLRQLLLERRLAGDMAAQAKKDAFRQGPDAVRDFKAFSEEFTRAFTQLNQACRERGQVGGAAELPWIMILGPSGVGKTTALERSGLHFTSLGRRLQGIGGTRNCTWWLASDAVFLDTAGRYAVQQEDRDEWRTFLHLLRRRRRRPIDAVLLQVGIDELLDRPRLEVERVAMQLRERLDELSSLLGIQVPIHLVFNKCDLIDGFIEFCGGLDEAERARPWGFRLDTTELGDHSVGTIFAERFRALVRALVDRLTARMLALPDRDPREATLYFPAELLEWSATLSHFTETLLEPRSRGERPWMCGVYLVSAHQTGQRAGGIRQRHAEKHGIGSRPAAVAGAVADGTFFLRGMFSQVLRQAEHAARPSAARQLQLRLRQRLAVAACMVACLCGSWFLGGRYVTEVRWLRELEQAAAQLQRSKGITGDARHVTSDELVQELALQSALREKLEDAPAGIPAGPQEQASKLLRQRVGTQLLSPLQGQLTTDLEAAARYQKGPGAGFSHGFGALWLAFVLGGGSCDSPGTDGETTNKSLSQFTLEHWQRALGDKSQPLTGIRADGEDPDRPRSAAERLRRNVTYLLQQTPGQLKATSYLKFDDGERASARQALKGGGEDGPAEPVFNLRASLTGLYEPHPQLGRTLVIQDPAGIAEAFTKTGCPTVFKSRGEERWGYCILGEQLPKEPANFEKVYNDRFLAAWNNWLQNLVLKQTDKNAAVPSLPAVIEMLEELFHGSPSSLQAVLQTMGKGQQSASAQPFGSKTKRRWFESCATRLFGKRRVEDTQRALRDSDMPGQCKDAQDRLAPFPQSGSQNKSEEDPQLASLREDYQKYVAAAQKLIEKLNKIKRSSDRNVEALALVQATLRAQGELSDLDSARDTFVTMLDRSLLSAGVKVAGGGLDNILITAEHKAWLAILPAAAKSLDEQWHNQVYEHWQLLNRTLASEEAQDEQRCKDRTEFLRKELADFVNKSLAGFFVSDNLEKGALKTAGAPFTERLPLLLEACARIQNAKRVGELTKDCPKALGAGGGSSASRDILKADIIPSTRPNCQATAQWIYFERGDKLFTCSGSNGICTPGPPTGQGAKIDVVWSNQPHSKVTLFKDAYWEHLDEKARKSGTERWLTVPVQQSPFGRCEGFIVHYQLAQGAGGPVPKAANNQWREVNLPEHLFKQGL